MLLVLDNYDSFTWNLVQLLGSLGAEPRVVRNDEMSVDQLLSLGAERIVVSPGPCTPSEAGASVELVRRAAGSVPILGVCLGHQAIAEAFGGRTVRAPEVMHGKVDPVTHRGRGLFRGLPSPLRVTRYHSLVTDPEALPGTLVEEAWSGADPADASGGRIIQAVHHREYPVWGIQFHPESLFSEKGKELLNNFLEGC